MRRHSDTLLVAVRAGVVADRDAAGPDGAAPGAAAPDASAPAAAQDLHSPASAAKFTLYSAKVFESKVVRGGGGGGGKEGGRGGLRGGGGKADFLKRMVGYFREKSFPCIRVNFKAFWISHYLVIVHPFNYKVASGTSLSGTV